MNRIDHRGANQALRSCVICGATYRPRTCLQETCGNTKCAQRNAQIKKTDYARAAHRVKPFDRQRIAGTGEFLVIEAPTEYSDYVGDVYNAEEMRSALEIGTLPPGIVLTRGKATLRVIGEPTPLDFALQGMGPYNHQALQEVQR